MRRSALALFVSLVAAIASPGQAGPISVRDMRGKIVTLDSAPKRIVSLAPAVTEILFAVGAGDRVVGVTSYCDYPPTAKTIAKIGDFRASAEKVIARRPDLVIASVSANAQSIPQIERLRIPVFAIDTQTVSQVLASIHGISAITGQSSGASRVIGIMKKKISSVQRRVAAAVSKPRTLIVVDVNGPWVAGRDTYMDDLVSMAGGINIARDAGSGWKPFSSEKVVVRKPEVVLVSDSNYARLSSLPGWSRIPAVVNNRIHGNLPISFVRPGPRLPQALEAVARLLHPELFAVQ